MRTQTVVSYHAYLVQQHAVLVAIEWRHRASEMMLLTKFCASLRSGLRRFLQDKHIDHQEYTISQLVQASSVREFYSRGTAPVATLNAFNAEGKWCFFCKSKTLDAVDCRKIAAKKAQGEWVDHSKRPARR